MRNINVVIPSMPFAKIEDRAAVINAAVLAYVQERSNIEALLTPESRALLSSMGLGADDVFTDEVKNGYHRIDFVDLYVYDALNDYERVYLERFEVTWSFEEERAV